MSYNPCAAKLINRGILRDKFYLRVCEDDDDTTGKSSIEIGPLYFNPEKKDEIKTMKTSLFGVNVNNLSGPLQQDIVNLYERYWNEKNGDMSGTWKDTAAAAGGKRSKKAKKTKKVKRSKRAKKSIKNKKC
jgi:hypothetical protein